MNLLDNFYRLFTENGLVTDMNRVRMLWVFTYIWTIIPLLICFLYYLIPPISKHFRSRIGWIIFLIISAIIVLITAYSTFLGLEAQNILKVKNDPNSGFRFGQGHSTFINFSFILLFLSTLLFFIYSLLIKRVSKYKFTTPF